MSCDWTDLVLAYLHDPPDKALAISGHEVRACRYASLATGREVRREDLHGTEDQLASGIERLPMPSSEKLRVGPEDGRLTIVHPLSGQHYQLEVGPVDEDEVAGVIEDIVRGLDPPKQFLALWRCCLSDLRRKNHFTASCRPTPVCPTIRSGTIWTLRQA
jgi:hypothetical protein